jgi:hypothetical protein
MSAACWVRGSNPELKTDVILRRANSAPRDRYDVLGQDAVNKNHQKMASERFPPCSSVPSVVKKNATR